MKTPGFCQKLIFSLVLAIAMTSCLREEDPGPLQNDVRDFLLLDFDRVDAGEAFVITIRQSPVYSIHAEGDRRNLDDLGITKNGSTLLIRYTDNERHDHTTYITIGMPSLAGANFSGASTSMISGFKEMSSVELILSGASTGQLSIESKQSLVNLSGASKLTITGKTDMVTAKVSGASELYSYPLISTNADVTASGASKVSVYASNILKAVASGASAIYYRGSPTVDVETSGEGVVRKD